MELFNIKVDLLKNKIRQREVASRLNMAESQLNAILNGIRQ